MAAKKNPYHVKHRAGRTVRPSDVEILRQAADSLREKGYTVLDSLFARTPGLLIFFATTYRADAASPDSLPPFGVTRVSFLNNGDVTIRVMGCLPDQGDSHVTTLKWK